MLGFLSGAASGLVFLYWPQIIAALVAWGSTARASTRPALLSAVLQWGATAAFLLYVWARGSDAPWFPALLQAACVAALVSLFVAYGSWDRLNRKMHSP